MAKWFDIEPMTGHARRRALGTTGSGSVMAASGWQKRLVHRSYLVAHVDNKIRNLDCRYRSVVEYCVETHHYDFLPATKSGSSYEYSVKQALFGEYCPYLLLIGPWNITMSTQMGCVAPRLGWRHVPCVAISSPHTPSSPRHPPRPTRAHASARTAPTPDARPPRDGSHHAAVSASASVASVSYAPADHQPQPLHSTSTLSTSTTTAAVTATRRVSVPASISSSRPVVPAMDPRISRGWSRPRSVPLGAVVRAVEQHWVTEMELLGEKGDVNAMATLIHMYTVGWGGMQPDLVKAEAWRKVRRTTLLERRNPE